MDHLGLKQPLPLFTNTGHQGSKKVSESSDLSQMDQVLSLTFELNGLMLSLTTSSISRMVTSKSILMYPSPNHFHLVDRMKKKEKENPEKMEVAQEEVVEDTMIRMEMIDVVVVEAAEVMETEETVTETEEAQEETEVMTEEVVATVEEVAADGEVVVLVGTSTATTANLISTATSGNHQTSLHHTEAALMEDQPHTPRTSSLRHQLQTRDKDLLHKGTTTSETGRCRSTNHKHHLLMVQSST